MSTVWVGQSRCHALWVTIDKYVKHYVTEHDVEEEPWYKKWYKLIHKDMLLDKERQFQFLAFQITGDPDSTVYDCIQSLFNLIPKLTEHIEIIDINEKGNIQYIVHNTPSVKPNLGNNPYKSLQDTHEDDDTSTNASPPQPSTNIPPTVRNISPITSTDNTPTRIFKSVYIEATTALDAMQKSDEKHTDPHLPTETTEFIANICSIYAHMKSNFEQSCTTTVRRHETLLHTTATRELNTFSEQYNDLRQKSCRQFDIDLQQRYQNKIDTLENKIKTLEQKLQSITSALPTTSASSAPTMYSSPKPTTPRSSTNVRKNFGPTKSPNINSTTNTIPHYFQTNNLKFEHQGDEYYLQDKDFIKNSPKIQAPDTEDDALTLYSQIQKNAIVYNIFLTPIDKITIWDHSPTSVPTTCNLTNTDDPTYYQAYQRSAVAIYTKLQTMDFSTVPVFKTLLDHERSSQDGYKVLYTMLCTCHPNLIEKAKIEPPNMTPNGNLFTFIRKYSNYIECERISKRSYTDMEILTFVTDTLDSDRRFEKALNIIRIQKNLHEEMLAINPKNPFPNSLTLETLPYTIMKVYSIAEKHLLWNRTINTCGTCNESTTIQSEI